MLQHGVVTQCSLQCVLVHLASLHFTFAFQILTFNTWPEINIIDFSSRSFSSKMHRVALQVIKHGNVHACACTHPMTYAHSCSERSFIGTSRASRCSVPGFLLRSLGCWAFRREASLQRSPPDPIILSQGRSLAMPGARRWFRVLPGDGLQFLNHPLPPRTLGNTGRGSFLKELPMALVRRSLDGLDRRAALSL